MEFPENYHFNGDTRKSQLYLVEILELLLLFCEKSNFLLLSVCAFCYIHPVMLHPGVCEWVNEMLLHSADCESLGKCRLFSF